MVNVLDGVLPKGIILYGVTNPISTHDWGNLVYLIKKQMKMYNDKTLNAVLYNS